MKNVFGWNSSLTRLRLVAAAASNTFGSLRQQQATCSPWVRTGWYQLTRSLSPSLIRDSGGEPDRRAVVAELVARRRRVLGRASVRDRLEVLALLVHGLAVGAGHGERAAVAAQDVDQGQFLERQVIEPERALDVRPRGRRRGSRPSRQAVEDDLDLRPVLVGFRCSLVEREVSARRPRSPSSLNSPPGLRSLVFTQHE